MAVIVPMLRASGASGRVCRVLTRVSTAALVTALAIVPLAVAASTPTVDGYPGYNAVLTCRSDAQNAEYAWAYATNGSTFAAGKTWRVDAPRVGYDVICQVTVDGATTNSAPVRIGPGRTTLSLKAKKVQHKKVTITGKAGPKAALEGGGIVAYRVESDGLHQLFGKATLKAGGQIKIVAPDIPGKHTYKVNFNADDPSLWQPASAKVKVRLKKR
jgi:hypothetical protein